MLMTIPAAIVGGTGLVALSIRLRARLALSLAKHRSLTGHPRMARRIAALMPSYDYDEHGFFRADDAPEGVAARRRDGFRRLSGFWRQRFARTLALTAEAAAGVSDLQFTAAYRVPFQFSRLVRQHLPTGSFLASSSGVTVTDLDGNVFYDLTGSYGVNLLGHDFYKDCIARGADRVRELGPVLGAYHPAVAYNVARLREISGLDEVSFHMSGTEAVMQAVRLARYHTNRSRLVRFCGAYHGWWGDVQPGIGNPVAADDTFTLAEMSERTLHVLRTRHDIACVLVNPLQALHPNAAAPADGSLVDSGRRAGFDRAAYTTWLQQLRAVCDARGIVLIFDDVFVGFRLALGGTREYFGVQPDLITYGKTLGGGLPVGVLCGRAGLMKRYRDDRPADVCFARGTFNSHPYVMGAMCEFLHRLETPEIQCPYRDLDRVWDGRAAQLNERLQALGCRFRWRTCPRSGRSATPCRPGTTGCCSIIFVPRGLPSVGSAPGGLVFSLNFTDDEFTAVADRFVAACEAMRDEGWWWTDGSLTNRSIRRRILREMWTHRRFFADGGCGSCQSLTLLNP